MKYTKIQKIIESVADDMLPDDPSEMKVLVDMEDCETSVNSISNLQKAIHKLWEINPKLAAELRNIRINTTESDSEVHSGHNGTVPVIYFPKHLADKFSTKDIINILTHEVSQLNHMTH